MIQSLQTINSQQTQTNANDPLKLVLLFTALGLTSYLLVKLSRSIVSELEK